MEKKIHCLAEIIKNLDAPLYIGEDCILRLAENKEVKGIESVVKNICEGINFGKYPYYDREKECYSYFVLENSSPSIEIAFSLSSLDTTFLTQNIYEESSVEINYNHKIISTYFSDYKVKTLNWEKSHLGEITDLSEKITSLFMNPRYKTDYDFIYKAFLDFSKLKEISIYSPFKILGIFAILELILTHKPDVSKNADNSITHQLKTKIQLLNNSINTPIKVEEYFQSDNLDKIIGKLYGYRSSIAHGTLDDVKIKLKDPENKTIYDFLYLVLKTTIKLSIEKPELIYDLRKC